MTDYLNIFFGAVAIGSGFIAVTFLHIFLYLYLYEKYSCWMGWNNPITMGTDYLQKSMLTVVKYCGLTALVTGLVYLLMLKVRFP